ncbi:MFS transporter [Chloroflexota bacterium]
MAHFGHHVVGAMLRPLMPMIRTDLGLSYTQAGVVIATFAIASGISQIPAGWLADRLGPRVIVAIGISGVAMAGLLIGLSQTYTGLIVFLILAAILGGGYHPASANAVSALVPSERRGQALGLHLIGGNSSFWVTPLLAAPIAVACGWRGSYIALAVPTIVLGIVLYFLIGRQTRYPVSRPKTVETEDRTAPDRIRWRQLTPFLVMTVTTGTMIRSVIAYLSLYAVDHFGASEATAAMLVAIAPGVGLFAAPLGGYLSDRLGGVPVLVAVCSLAVPLIYLMGIVPNVPALAAVMVVVGIANTTRAPTSEAYIVGHTPKRRRSTILGLYFFAGMEISGLLAPVIGNLIDRFGFYRSFTIASIFLATVAVVCSMFLWRNRASAHNPSPD